MEFLEHLFKTLVIFLPAYYANMCPGFARGWNLPGDIPISEKWLGAHKTWRGHYASILGGTIMAFILHFFVSSYQEHWLELGLLMGIGAKGGDDIKSFIKRRLGKKPGARWWPYDQIDYIIGAILCSLPVTGWLGWDTYVIVITPTMLLHGVLARRAFKKGQKRVPY